MPNVAILEPAPLPNPVLVTNPRPLAVRPECLPAAALWTGGRDEAAAIWVRAYDSSNTRASYAREIRAWFRHCDLYGIDIAHARRGDVDAWRYEMEDEDPRPSPATVRHRITTVSSFYRYWLDEEVVSRNPAAHARRPKASRTPGSIALTLAQAKQLVDYTDQLPDVRPGLVVRLLLETGMRVSELCAAQVTDLGTTSGHRTLTIVRKGGIEAVTVLLPATAHRLEEYLQGRTSGPLLATNGCKRGGVPGPLDRGYVRDLSRRLAREAGLPREVCERMHPHVYRHTAATLLDEAGTPMQRIQRQLGHADIRQTELYAGHRQELEASPVYVLGSLLAA